MATLSDLEAQVTHTAERLSDLQSFAAVLKYLIAEQVSRLASARAALTRRRNEVRSSEASPSQARPDQVGGIESNERAGGPPQMADGPPEAGAGLVDPNRYGPDCK